MATELPGIQGVNAKRLPIFEDAIVRYDAEWFWNNGFISADLYWRVISWLGGIDDREAQLTVASWMDKDAEWVEKFTPDLLKRFWYLKPFHGLGHHIMYTTRDTLKEKAAQLRQELS